MFFGSKIEKNVAEPPQRYNQVRGVTEQYTAAVISITVLPTMVETAVGP